MVSDNNAALCGHRGCSQALVLGSLSRHFDPLVEEMEMDQANVADMPDSRPMTFDSPATTDRRQRSVPGEKRKLCDRIAKALAGRQLVGHNV